MERLCINSQSLTHSLSKVGIELLGQLKIKKMITEKVLEFVTIFVT